MKYQIKSLLIATLSLLSYAAEASLIDRYNDVNNKLNITWSQDDHFAQTADVENEASSNWTVANEQGGQLTVDGINDRHLSELTSSEQGGFSNSGLHYQEVQGNHIEEIKGDNHLSSVPVPAAIWLFASGLLGFLAISSRKRGI
jgi:hypothetical protein